MKSIRDVVGEDLFWAQTHALKHEYELRAGDGVVATLRWQKRFGSLALGEAAEGAWTFKRGGFLRPHVTIREANSGIEVARFEAGWLGGGTIELHGVTLRFGTSNFWGSEQAWTNASDEHLIYFKDRSSLLKSRARVTIEPSAASTPELSLLVLLGWYVTILTAEGEAIVAGGAAAGGAG